MRAFEDLTLLHAFVCIVECGSISAGTGSIRVFAKDASPNAAGSRLEPDTRAAIYHEA